MKVIALDFFVSKIKYGIYRKGHKMPKYQNDFAKNQIVRCKESNKWWDFCPTYRIVKVDGDMLHMVRIDKDAYPQEQGVVKIESYKYMTRDVR